MAEICSTCGEEIRFGVRNPTPQWPGPRWLHREEVDHVATHGVTLTPERWAEIEQRKAAIVEAKNGKKAEEPEKEDGDDDSWIGEELPEPEQRATEIEVDDLPPRSGMRQVANLVLKTPGWELRKLTHARGPFIGARGQVLSISDHVVLKALGEQVDQDRPFAVASWRDGKFRSAYIGTIKAGVMRTRSANSEALKNWIKTAHDVPDPLLEPGE